MLGIFELKYKRKNKKFLNILFVTLFLVSISISACAGAWKLSKNFWSEDDEKTYQTFVHKLGKSKYRSLNKFIKDSKANPLYGSEDKKISLYPDCADLPYQIRAYVAYKLRLPFSYVSEISGNGGDERYSSGNKPRAYKDQDYFSSPQKLFSKVTLVNTGYYRMSAKRSDTDHYPVKVQAKSIVPGTIYYDPNGHVAMVYDVTEDGRIRMIDAHPDKTISKPWFGAKFARGSKSNGGGFKNWRPIRYTSAGHVSRTSNHNIVDFSETDQFQKRFTYKGFSNLSYYDYTRKSLSKKGGKIFPLKDFTFMMYDIFEDIQYRALAVDVCIKKGINNRKHPGVLPYNIYGTDGLWETYSTPSRDARLKVSFKDFFMKTISFIRGVEQASPEIAYNRSAVQLASDLLNTYNHLSSKLVVVYQNSLGKNQALTFDDVLQRLFKMSFDPYHSPELRWGASSKELETANDTNVKKRLYNMEARLRGQLERIYGKPTPFSLGPITPPNINIKQWLQAYLQGAHRQSPTNIVSLNPVFAGYQTTNKANAYHPNPAQAYHQQMSNRYKAYKLPEALPVKQKEIKKQFVPKKHLAENISSRCETVGKAVKNIFANGNNMIPDSKVSPAVKRIEKVPLVKGLMRLGEQFTIAVTRHDNAIPVGK